MRRRCFVLFALFVHLCTSCSRGVSNGTGSDVETFVIASTTSTQDSGILDSLTASFEKEFPNLRAKVLAVGSGEAIELGFQGDADILLVHSPPEEEEFMRKGRGLYRKPLMSNQFAIAGPVTDPVGIKGERSPETAFRRIASNRATFASRGDGSGTHRAEAEIWRSAGIDPKGDWYLETGQGMGETITIAAEKSAYLLTDTATLRTFGARIDLEILVRNDRVLGNPYSVIPVKGARHRDAAKKFAEWVTGPTGQSIIARFGKREFGVPLFSPANA